MERVRAGVLGGLLASLVMDLAQGGFTELFEKGRPPGDLDEEVEAIAGVVRHLKRIVPPLVPNESSETLGHVLHYLFGGGFGVAYVLARTRDERAGIGAGLGFGIALWLLSDRILIPSLKLGRPWARYSFAERSNALVSHVAYAMTLEGFLRRALR